MAVPDTVDESNKCDNPDGTFGSYLKGQEEETCDCVESRLETTDCGVCPDSEKVNFRLIDVGEEASGSETLQRLEPEIIFPATRRLTDCDIMYLMSFGAHRDEEGREELVRAPDLNVLDGEQSRFAILVSESDKLEEIHGEMTKTAILVNQSERQQRIRNIRALLTRDQIILEMNYKLERSAKVLQSLLLKEKENNALEEERARKRMIIREETGTL